MQILRLAKGQCGARQQARIKALRQAADSSQRVVEAGRLIRLCALGIEVVLHFDTLRRLRFSKLKTVLGLKGSDAREDVANHAPRARLSIFFERPDEALRKRDRFTPSNSTAYFVGTSVIREFREPRRCGYSFQFRQRGENRVLIALSQRRPQFLHLELEELVLNPRQLRFGVRIVRVEADD